MPWNTSRLLPLAGMYEGKGQDGLAVRHAEGEQAEGAVLSLSSPAP